MKKKLFGFILVILCCSCDGYYEYSGQVKSKETNAPLPNVKVTFSCYETALTDSLGYFTIETIIPGPAVKKDLLFYKDGYIPYVSYSQNEDIIFLKTQNKTEEIKDISDQKRFNIYRVNMILVSLINIFTLIMVFVLKKIRYKFIWTVAILLSTISVNYSVLSSSLSVDFFKFIIPLKMTCLGTWIIIFIPIGSVIFWGLFFYRVKRNTLNVGLNKSHN